MVNVWREGNVAEYHIFNGTHIRLNTFVKNKTELKVEKEKKTWILSCDTIYNARIMHNFRCRFLHPYLKFVYRFLCIFLIGLCWVEVKAVQINFLELCYIVFWREYVHEICNFAKALLICFSNLYGKLHE